MKGLEGIDGIEALKVQPSKLSQSFKTPMTKSGSIILRIYFALIAFVTLMMLIFSVSDLLNITLKTYVFTAADAPEYVSPCFSPEPLKTEAPKTTGDEKAHCEDQRKQEEHSALVRKQQNAVRDISMLLVSLPLFWLHWRIVYRDWMEEHEEKKA